MICVSSFFFNSKDSYLLPCVLEIGDSKGGLLLNFIISQVGLRNWRL